MQIYFKFYNSTTITTFCGRVIFRATEMISIKLELDFFSQYISMFTCMCHLYYKAAAKVRIATNDSLPGHHLSHHFTQIRSILEDSSR